MLGLLMKTVSRPVDKLDKFVLWVYNYKSNIWEIVAASNDRVSVWEIASRYRTYRIIRNTDAPIGKTMNILPKKEEVMEDIYDILASSLSEEDIEDLADYMIQQWKRPSN